VTGDSVVTELNTVTGMTAQELTTVVGAW